jgi:hypothetical protein
VLRTTRRNTHFEDVAPVFSFVIEPLIEHLHYLNEVVSVHALLVEVKLRLTREMNELIIGHLRDLIHLCARGAPWVVGSGLTDFSLYI